MIKIYVKKPLPVHAVKLAYDNLEYVATWSDSVVDGDSLLIDTLEGEMRASLGDYVIRGVKGEFYPCKPDIFEMSYELHTDDTKHG